MRRFIWASSYLAGGIAAGALSAFAVIQSSGVEHVASGTPWLSRQAALVENQSFYVRAHYLLGGRLPPAAGQLSEATAETDTENRPLTGACTFRIASTGPLPAWWSFTVVEADGSLAPLQSALDSSSIIREPDGSVVIRAHPSPRPGNWLKTPERRRFTLLYSALPQGRAVSTPPFEIRQEACP
jgi:hypothetical protein